MITNWPILNFARRNRMIKKYWSVPYQGGNSVKPKSIASNRLPINIRSEFSSLKTVLVHEPGIEIDRLTPDNLGSLLFEDIPYLPKMRLEHKAFVDLLRSEGVNVLILNNLLLDILEIETVRIQLVNLCCGAGLQASLSNILLDYFSPKELCEVLLSGLTSTELFEKTGKRLGPPDERDDPFLLDPAPNAYFTRDPAAAIGNQIISCKMNYSARVRESIITREIFRSHPLFAGTPILYGDNGAEDRPYTIEGGDFIVINNKAVAVGCSQRTRSESIATLAQHLFENGLAQRVYEINIPGERVYMHLDTVFTIVDEGLVVAYPDVMSDIKEIRRYEPLIVSGGEMIALPIEENRNFNTILEDEFGRLTVINTGNNKRRYASREQQADGTNVFALRPSTVITYERNTHTNEALRAEGIKTLLIEGSELVRGLGGPRCMTMPLQRDEDGDQT